MEIEFGNGKNMLYRYLIPDVMKKRHVDHPDPLFEEYTYGDSGKYGNMIRKNVESGSHIFFHTTIGGQRYITAHYYVSRVMEGYEARHNDEIRKKFNNIHIHPENYPDWWYDYDVDLEEEDDSSDIVVFGDPEKSLGKLKNPIPFDRDFGEKLDFENTQIEFEIVNKKGRVMNDAECITSCTRVPRYLTKNDVKFLINEINSLNGGEKVDFEPEIESIGNEAFVLDTKFSEKQLEEIIFHNPEILEDGLEIISRQQPISSGRLDLLLKNKSGDVIILEIKEGFPRDSVVTQVLNYKNDIEKMYPDNNIKAAILCQDCSSRVRNAAKNVGIDIYSYGTYFIIGKEV